MGKKFDICLMNPPYDNGLHYKFLNKCIDISNKIITVQPAGWITRSEQTPNKEIKALYNTFDKYGADIECIDANKYFDAGFNDKVSINVIDVTKQSDIYFTDLSGKTLKYNTLNDITLFSSDDLLVKFSTCINNDNDVLLNHIRCTEYLKAGIKNKKEKIVKDNENTNNWYCVNIAQIRGHNSNGLDNDFYTLLPKNRVPEKFNVKNSYLILPFNKLELGNNCINYLKTDFVRAILYLYKDTTQTISTMKYIPWQDFSDEVFSKSPKEIDDYLFSKYKISDEIRKHIEDILPDYYGIRK